MGKKADIEKIADNKTIRVFSEKNYISLRLNNDKTRVDIQIDDFRTDELSARLENSKLNIYHNFRIDLVQNENINKLNNNMIIKVFNETNFISLEMNSQK